VSFPSSNKVEAGSSAEPLRALRRGGARADGFALYVAVFKSPVQRNHLITLLQEGIPTAQIQTVTIRPDATDILDEILHKQLSFLIGRAASPVELVISESKPNPCFILRCRMES
jgi:hypothetical protein